eukprot:4321103-Prymnesium_polylepis.1
MQVHRRRIPRNYIAAEHELRWTLLFEERAGAQFLPKRAARDENQWALFIVLPRVTSKRINGLRRLGLS